jgi:SAM-dependent methyltransferase
VDCLDYSDVGINIIRKIAKEKGITITANMFDIKKPLPYADNSFDSVYSHMLLNMRFTIEELRFVFSEIARVLKPKGFNFFSVRNENDRMYKKGVEVQDGVYDINGFQVRFYTRADIESLTKDAFHIQWIKEEFEDPVTLYLVSSIKM